MEIIYVLIPLSLILVGVALWGFFWAVKNGQFDDLESPALDILDGSSEQLEPSKQLETSKQPELDKQPELKQQPGPDIKPEPGEQPLEGRV